MNYAILLYMGNYHKTVEKILTLLNENNCWYEAFEHEPVRTSEEAAKLRHGYTLHQGAKALIIRAKIPNEGKQFIIVVIPGDAKFDNDKVKMLLHAKDIRFATEQEISTITEGILPGGVPPFGNLFNLKVIVDNSLFENEKIIFNAGDRSFSIAMFAQDYKKIVTPEISNIIL
jgi:Ala-tRNA(Pro) deacylase